MIKTKCRRLDLRQNQATQTSVYIHNEKVEYKLVGGVAVYILQLWTE